MPQSPHSITIDKWIDEAKHCVSPPSDVLVPFRSLDYLLWQDNVECILKVKQKEALADGLFDEFKLTLCIRIPESSGFLMYYRHSPIVVIDKYTGEEDDPHAPEWLQAQQPERKFWQPRSLVLDLMIYFVASFHENVALTLKVKSWCEAISSKVPVSGISTSIGPRPYIRHFSPYSTRSHKQRASELSMEESQRVRKTLNSESSPLQKRK